MLRAEISAHQEDLERGRSAFCRRRINAEEDTICIFQGWSLLIDSAVKLLFRGPFQRHISRLPTFHQQQPGIKDQPLDSEKDEKRQKWLPDC